MITVAEMVDRFLGWRLPEDFHPDAGIEFTPPPEGFEHIWPTGTNLFTAEQADLMVRHMLGSASELATLERELAEECAIAILESECLHRDDGWLDTSAYAALESRRKELQLRLQVLQNRRNTSAKSIAQVKSRGEDIQPLLDEVCALGQDLETIEAELRAVRDEQDLDGALRYLELRGLLERHPENHDWVRILEPADG